MFFVPANQHFTIEIGDYDVAIARGDGSVYNYQVALVNAGMVSFAAGDDEHLVAVSGGSADVHGSLLTSANGGRTWRNVVDPALPERGWRWVGAPGAKWFYLLPTEGEKAYWWAQDFGDTWSKVPMD